MVNGDESNKPVPGQWSDGTVTGNDDLEKFYAEESESRAQKNKLIEDLSNTEQITPQFVRLLRSIHTSTFGAEGATLRKIRAVLAMRKMLKDQGITQRYTANLGAGIDWQFPVALGAREIVMVDQDYQRKDVVVKLFESVRQFDGKTQMKDGNRPDILFGVDLGEGREDITLHLDSSEITKYQPQQPLGFVLEFAGPSKGPNRSRVPVLPNIARAMTDDGLVFNLDYPHKTLFTPGLGMDVVESGGFYLYKVHDKRQMITASSTIFSVANDGTLEQLRAINKLHLERGNK